MYKISSRCWLQPRYYESFRVIFSALYSFNDLSEKSTRFYWMKLHSFGILIYVPLLVTQLGTIKTCIAVTKSLN